MWDGYTSNFCIQVQVKFDKLRAFCVGTKKFNALMVLSHFIGSKPFLGGTMFIVGQVKVQYTGKQVQSTGTQHSALPVVL